MEENKFKLAGWLAVVQAVLFPLGLVMGIIERGLAGGTFDDKRPLLGTADLIMIAFTIIAIYTLLMFRKLLHERYEYRDLDLLIIVSIWWAIVFQAVGLLIGIIAGLYWPVDRVMLAVVYAVFLTGAMVTIGIVDILIAVKLLKIKESLGEYVRGFAYVTMAAGICEVTVLLSPLSLMLVPASAIILALIFFRDEHEVEFV